MTNGADEAPLRTERSVWVAVEPPCCDEHGGGGVCGVYSTRELAEAAAPGADVSEWRLDAPPDFGRGA